MTDSGWFALYRGALNHPFFRRKARKKDEFSEFEAWVWMLERAAFKERKDRVHGLITVQRGQFAASTRYMAQAFKWPETNVRSFILRLENEQMVSTETRAVGTVVTICNYNELQPEPGQNGAEPAQNPRTSRAEPAQRERRKEGKKEINTPSPNGEGGAPTDLFPGTELAVVVPLASASPPRRASGWPPGFALDPDLQRFAESKGIAPGQVADVWEHFRNHHTARGTTFKDWRAAWRTWCQNQQKFGRTGVRGPGNRHNTPSGFAPGMDAGIHLMNRVLKEDQDG